MNANKLPLLLLFLPLLLFSCKRLDGDTLVEGKVVDKHTGAAVPHAWVEVYAARSSASWGGYAFVEKHQANQNGDFGFQFEGKGDDYRLRAYTDLGHSTSWNDAVSVRQGKNNKNLKLKVDAPAWVKIILKDELPLDDIWITIGGYKPVSSILPFPTDTVFIDQILGNRQHRIQWLINNNGNQQHFQQDIFAPALDTTSLEIKF